MMNRSLGMGILVSATLVGFALIASFAQAPAALARGPRTTPTIHTVSSERTAQIARTTVARTPEPSRSQPVADPQAVLHSCASDFFGVTATYSRAAGVSGIVLRILNIPTAAYGTIDAAIDSNVTAVYGVTANNGAEVVVYGKGTTTLSNGNLSLQLANGSLCYFQYYSTSSLPASADQALKLLVQTFPGVPQRTSLYTLKKNQHGYSFVLTTARPIAAGSSQTTAQTIVLSALQSNGGTGLVLSAMSGTGTFSQRVAAP